MNAYAGCDYHIGAEGQSYPEVAARAVQSVHPQHQSPYYGYIRSGRNQKIYVFGTLEDVTGWFGQHARLQPDHDYAAAFAATDLSAPMPGMQHFMPHVSGDPYVGSLWPFLAGLPLGGLGGYLLRRWQEGHPGQSLPGLPPGALPPPAPVSTPPAAASGDWVGGPWIDMVGPTVGGPWVDMYETAIGGPWVDMYETAIGGPWVDLVGASVDDASRRRQAQALIQSAISEVQPFDASYPAAAYVWTLDAPSHSPHAGSAPGSTVTLEGTTNVVPFSSHDLALNYLREIAQSRPVALALFDRSSPHWPNPIAWRKSDDPESSFVIAQHLANQSTSRTSGDYGVGATIGTALDDVRHRAQTLADRRSGDVVGVIHTSKDGLWHTLAFRSADDADDWLGTATHDPASYTYAAYFDKEDYSWPHPVNEKIGGGRATAGRGERIMRAPATTSGRY